MKANIKIPSVITTSNDDGSEIDMFVGYFKELTGLKLKKTRLTESMSSCSDWLLYLKKDRNYTAALEKFLKESFLV